jgi:phage-related protein
MADYNSGKYYNKSVYDDGALYNSATYYIVNVSNHGLGIDVISSIIASLSVSDSGSGAESVSDIDQYDADSYFVVTTDRMLQPLGVYVIGSNKNELLPSTRDITEEVPGRHGEIDFGSEFKARLLELHVATPDGLTAEEKKTLARNMAKFLNPVSGTKKLIYLDDENVMYVVKYSGKIDLTKYPSWMEFVIPFKMSDPFILSVLQNSLTGPGTVTNSGTFETPVLIEIPGPANNPTVSVGGNVLSYGAYVSTGTSLYIDTEAKTVKNGSVNAVADFSGSFPQLAVGDTEVDGSISATIFKWYDKYL